MALPDLDPTYRVPGDNTQEAWWTHKIDLPVKGLTGHHMDGVSLISRPYANPLYIAGNAGITAGVTAIADYPLGDGAIQTSGSNSTTAAALPASCIVDPTNMVLLFVVDTPSGVLGFYRRITSVTGSTGAWIAHWTTALPGAVTSGTQVVLGLACELLTNAFVRGEYQAAADATDPAQVVFAFYGQGLDGGSGAAKRPMRVDDNSPLTIPNLGFSAEPTITSYFKGGRVLAPCYGAAMFKVRLSKVPTTNDIALWAWAA